MRQSGLFTNPTNNQFGADSIFQSSQIFIDCRIIFDNRIFDPRNRPTFHQSLNILNFDIAQLLDVDHSWLSGGLNKITNCSLHAFIGHDVRLRQDHGCWIRSITQYFGLIHHHAVRRSHRGDYQSVFRCPGLKLSQQIGILARCYMIEQCVTTIEQSGNSTTFQMSNKFLVFLSVK